MLKMFTDAAAFEINCVEFMYKNYKCLMSDRIRKQEEVKHRNKHEAERQLLIGSLVLPYKRIVFKHVFN